MYTTLNNLKKYEFYRLILIYTNLHLNKKVDDDEILHLDTVLEHDGLKAALWVLSTIEGYENEIRSYLTMCLRRSQIVIKNSNVIEMLDFIDSYLKGNIDYNIMKNECDKLRQTLLSNSCQGYVLPEGFLKILMLLSEFELCPATVYNIMRLLERITNRTDWQDCIEQFKILVHR